MSQSKELLWQSRFSQPFDQEALRFSSSVHVDGLLYREDIQGSIAHATMLGEEGIISPDESKQIIEGLQAVEEELASGKLTPVWEDEDIHTVIENRLKELIGPAAGKLHSGRSRNDQVATDTRLYLRRNIDRLTGLIEAMQSTLLDKAERYQKTIMFGYTHLQRAQPMSAGHYYMAWHSMFGRDASRLRDLRNRADFSPLGAAAFAGSTLPLNTFRSAELLGFSDVFTNSIDAVSDRDLVIEFISACSVIMMHLSRFSEDVILWSSAEFNYLEISDAFATGSSIMPQKKNADIAELVRGKTGRVYGNLMNILTIMKGLPLSYNRDMQEDKPPLFDTAETTAQSLSIFRRMIENTWLNEERLSKLTAEDLSLATEIAEYLVKKQVPFRDAHRITGKIVAYAIEKGKTLPTISIEEYREFSEAFDEGIYADLTPDASVSSKKTSGSCSFASVAEQIRKARAEAGRG